MNETDRARTSEKIAAIRDSNSKYFYSFIPDRYHYLQTLAVLDGLVGHEVYFYLHSCTSESW